MERCVEWYRTVLDTEPTDHGRNWSSFRVSSANIALHFIEEPMSAGKVELSLVSLEPLEKVVSRLEDAGVDVARGIADEAFGRSIRLVDPEGMSIQINEHDPDLYAD
jgi:hypothetical protein